MRGQVRERDSVSEQEEEGMSEIREDQAADNDSDGNRRRKRRWTRTVQTRERNRGAKDYKRDCEERD